MAGGGVVTPTFRKVFTLAFLEKGEEILLGFKKRGLGSGLWNGFGGKVEEGESVHEAAAREIREECGLEVMTSDLEEVGLIHFHFTGDPIVLQAHLFRTSVFSGEVGESEEMDPKWWPKDGLPFHQMWPDDIIWYPLFTKGIPFRALFLIDMAEGPPSIMAYQITSMNKETAEEAVLLEDNSQAFSLQELWSKIKALPIISVPRGQRQGHPSAQTQV